MIELKFSQIKQICDITGASPTELPEIFDSGDWLLLTDSESNEYCHEYILDSLWAFRPEFLSGETGLDVEVFRSIQSNDRCESNNEAIQALIKSTCGLESFIDSAIGTDGRGHFISSYDGEEHEISGDLFLYRIN